MMYSVNACAEISELSELVKCKRTVKSDQRVATTTSDGKMYNGYLVSVRKIAELREKGIWNLAHFIFIVD